MCVYIYMHIQISTFACGSLHYLWTWHFCDFIAVISLISYQNIPLKVNNALYILMRESKLLIAKNLNCAKSYCLSYSNYVCCDIGNTRFTLHFIYWNLSHSKMFHVLLVWKSFLDFLQNCYAVSLQQFSSLFLLREARGLQQKKKTCWCQILRVFFPGFPTHKGYAKKS